MTTTTDLATGRNVATAIELQSAEGSAATLSSNDVLIAHDMEILTVQEDVPVDAWGSSAQYRSSASGPTTHRVALRFPLTIDRAASGVFDVMESINGSTWSASGTASFTPETRPLPFYTVEAKVANAKYIKFQDAKTQELSIMSGGDGPAFLRVVMQAKSRSEGSSTNVGDYTPPIPLHTLSHTHCKVQVDGVAYRIAGVRVRVATGVEPWHSTTANPELILERGGRSGIIELEMRSDAEWRALRQKIEGTSTVAIRIEWRIQGEKSFVVYAPSCEVDSASGERYLSGNLADRNLISFRALETTQDEIRLSWTT